MCIRDRLSLSQSASFRAELKAILDACPLVWKLVTAFTIMAVLSVGISIDPSTSLGALVVVLLNWTLIFFVAAYVLAKDGRMERFAYLTWFAALFVCLVGAWEARVGAVPWAGHIPSFLKIEDPIVQNMLAGASRIGGDPRVQSKFTTPLSLAEFISCALPFTFFIIFHGRRWIFRVSATLTVPLIFYIVHKTDARLGVIGCICAIVLFAALYGLEKFKNDKSSLFASAIVYSVPVAGFLFLVSTFFIGRIRNAVWGSGQQIYSTNARYEQVNSAIPKILSHPWGYGLEKGAVVLDYRLPSGMLTIDNYYLALTLDLGVVGVLVFIGMLFAVIYTLLNQLMRSVKIDRNLTLMGVVLIVVIQFAVIKLVLAQFETHAYFFAVLGGAVGLAYRQALAKQARPPIEKGSQATEKFAARRFAKR